MFGPRFHLFDLFGFKIYIDLSWFIIAILVTWSLAEGWFAQYDEFAEQALLRWGMGIAGALGLFASIILHELGHAKVARTQGVEMRGITLFIFGGVAEMNDEPPTPKAEFLVAIGGPIVSVVIAVICYGLAAAGWALGLVAITAVVFWLAIINTVLLVFNMVPAFPLDGGRVLRSILWGIRRDLRWATRVTSLIGSGFGVVLMIFGAYSVLAGNPGGFWLGILGLFLFFAARMSYQQLLLRRALEGEPIDRFMSKNPVTVSPQLPLDQLIEDYVYRYHFKMFPVVEDDDRLRGCVTLNQFRDVPREQWAHKRVEDLLTRCGPENTIPHDADAMAALSRMRSNDRSRLMVVEHDRLVGVVSLKDLMDFLSLKIELEEHGMANTTRSDQGKSDAEGRPYDQAA